MERDELMDKNPSKTAKKVGTIFLIAYLGFLVVGTALRGVITFLGEAGAPLPQFLKGDNLVAMLVLYAAATMLPSISVSLFYYRKAEMKPAIMLLLRILFVSTLGWSLVGLIVFWILKR